MGNQVEGFLEAYKHNIDVVFIIKLFCSFLTDIDLSVEYKREPFSESILVFSKYIVFFHVAHYCIPNELFHQF